jgi:hypothetical protein
MINNKQKIIYTFTCTFIFVSLVFLSNYSTSFAQTNRDVIINEGTYTGPQGGNVTSNGGCPTGSFQYKTLVNIPGFGTKNAANQNVVTICPNSLGDYLQVGFNYFIGIAIALAVIMIIYGGVLYATTDAVSGKSSGKKVIQDAAYGLALALGSWLILYTINPDFLKFQLDIGRLDLQAGSVGGQGAIAALQGGNSAPNQGGDLVVDGTSREIATRLLALDRENKIALGTRVLSGTQASARQNIVDIAAGRPASLSNGNRILIDARTLAMLEALNTRYNFTLTVSAIVGGGHSANSRHYVGKAIDISQINGVGVGGSGSRHRELMNACRALGATEVLGPGDAGHSTHVHCSLAR